MATAPTLVSSGVVTGSSSSWGTDKPKTHDIAMLTGDRLVVIGIGSDYGGSGDDFSTPTGGGMTYTLRQQAQVTLNSFPWGWTAQTSSDQTVTLSVTISTNSPRYGAVWSVWRNSDGYDSSAQAHSTGGASIDITTGTDNCGLTVGIGDWNAVDGASRTYRTVNSYTPTAGGAGEIAYNRIAGEYSAYGTYYPDAGAAGTKTVGFSAPTTSVKFFGVVVAMKGSSSANATVNAGVIATTASLPAAAPSGGATVSPSAIAGVAALPARTVQTGSTVTPAVLAAVTSVPAPAIQVGVTLTPAAVATTAALPAAGASAGSTVSPTAITTTTALPSPAVQTGVTLHPATVATTASTPAPAVQTGSTVAADVVATTAALPTVAVSAGSTVTPAAIAGVAAFPTVGVTTGGDALIQPATIAAVASLPAATVHTGHARAWARMGGVLVSVTVSGSVRENGASVPL